MIIDPLDVALELTQFAEGNLISPSKWMRFAAIVRDRDRMGLPENDLLLAAVGASLPPRYGRPEGSEAILDAADSFVEADLGIGDRALGEMRSFCHAVENRLEQLEWQRRESGALKA